MRFIVQDVPSPDPSTWKFQVASGWLGDRNAFPTNASRAVELKRRGALLPEPFRSAILDIPDDSDVNFDAINYWESKLWDTRDGRVVLAGDAAHAMPPRELFLSLSICCRCPLFPIFYSSQSLLIRCRKIVAKVSIMLCRMLTIW